MNVVSIMVYNLNGKDVLTSLRQKPETILR